MSEDENTYVTKRNGTIEELNPDKITRRVRYLIHKDPVLKGLNPVNVMLKTTSKLRRKISTVEIDDFAAEQCANMSIRDNPNYLQLAARISIDNHQKQTLNSFYDKMMLLYLNKDSNGVSAPLISKSFMKFVENNKSLIERIIDYSLDFNLTYFGFKSLFKGYLMNIGKRVIERPQDLFMRVAIHIHMDNGMERIRQTYKNMTNGYFTHASPTLFNSGTLFPQMSSCFLLGLSDKEGEGDSLEGIMQLATNCAKISKRGGGIGIDISALRSDGSLIRSTNGISGGVPRFLPIFNSVGQSFDQGGGKRKGSIAMYLPPHHPDFPVFLTQKLLKTREEIRAKDLYYGAWISDLFMKRFIANDNWSMFDPNKFPELYELYGDEFEKLYTKLENEGLYQKQMKARDIFNIIHHSKAERGSPYICFSDNANKYNNQKNLGTLRCSNLCTEIFEYSNLHETAVCNLASICLNKIIVDSYTEEECDVENRRPLNHEFPVNPKIDIDKLIEITRNIVRNLNIVIDKNHYPTIESSRSNFRHRPIGIGVQGLWDAFMKMRYPFDSPSAKKLNKVIFETIYFAAISESTNLAKKKYLQHVQEIRETGRTEVTVYSNPSEYAHLPPQDRYFTEKVIYEDIASLPKTVGSYPSMLWNGGSPISKGIFNWEMYGLSKDKDVSNMFDWEILREHIKMFGTVNSLLIAPMPTASTSQIMGNNECIEPITSNIYMRNTLAGHFMVINKYLVNDLMSQNMWNDHVVDELLASEGSVQSLDIPEKWKNLYKIAFEIDQKVLIDLAIDRQPFVDQGQSLNLYTPILTKKKFAEWMIHAWKNGLKTGVYYAHTKAGASAKKVTIDVENENKERVFGQVVKTDYKDDDSKLDFLTEKEDACILCSG